MRAEECLRWSNMSQLGLAARDWRTLEPAKRGYRPHALMAVITTHWGDYEDFNDKFKPNLIKI